jgi:hypothetical protein
LAFRRHCRIVVMVALGPRELLMRTVPWQRSDAARGLRVHAAISRPVSPDDHREAPRRRFLFGGGRCHFARRVAHRKGTMLPGAVGTPDRSNSGYDDRRRHSEAASTRAAWPMAAVLAENLRVAGGATGHSLI